MTVQEKAQRSYAVSRKFLWLWAYEQTPDGTLYLAVTLDHEVQDEHLKAVTQTSRNRWNHSGEVTSLATARAKWLRELVRAGHEFAR